MSCGLHDEDADADPRMWGRLLLWEVHVIKKDAGPSKRRFAFSAARLRSSTSIQRTCWYDNSHRPGYQRVNLFGAHTEWPPTAIHADRGTRPGGESWC